MSCRKAVVPACRIQARARYDKIASTIPAAPLSREGGRGMNWKLIIIGGIVFWLVTNILGMFVTGI
ncbi:MAG: hypothetical protein WBO54_16245, partial [Thermoanaerobaculia bacterium]